MQTLRCFGNFVLKDLFAKNVEHYKKCSKQFESSDGIKILFNFSKKEHYVHHYYRDQGFLIKALHECNADTTLFLVTSKAFTTSEKLANSTTQLAINGDVSDIAKYYLALSKMQTRWRRLGLTRPTCLGLSRGLADDIPFCQ
ncbi:glucose-6-phosphate isomerase [Rhizina undulata]